MDLVEKLKTQALAEIKFAYDYKKQRMADWNLVEDALKGKVLSSDTGGSNLNILKSKANGFLQTWVSKVDAPLSFKYRKGEPADRKKAVMINSLKEKDEKIGQWVFKDLLGKINGCKYGRVVNYYFADHIDNNYHSNLFQIDVKDFGIDPEAGGCDVEKAMYLGWWNTKMTKVDLLNAKKSGDYINSAIDSLLAGGGNNTEVTEEEIDKGNRFLKYLMPNSRSLKRTDLWKFYTWITTWEDGQRYYMILTPHGEVIRCQKYTDVKKSGKYPIWTWATYPDEFEFWSPSPFDYAIDIFMAQDVSINQLLDNSEKINRPQKAVNVDLITNLSKVKYKKDGIIEIAGATDVNKAVQVLQTAPISVPLDVYNALEGIVGLESGITPAVKGMAEDEKVGIYEGNVSQVSDRFSLLSKSYQNGYYNFGILYKEGVEEHLNKKVAVEMIGDAGLEIEWITKRDIKPTKGDFDILVESSTAEADLNNQQSKNKIAFLGSYKGDTNINQKVLFETQAQIAGLTDDEITALLDTSDYGTIKVIAEADNAFQLLLKGKPVPDYKFINTAYMQRVVDLSAKYDHELTDEQHDRVFAYLESIKDVVLQNTTRKLTEDVAKMGELDGFLSKESTNGANGSPEAGLGQENALPGGQMSELPPEPAINEQVPGQEQI